MKWLWSGAALFAAGCVLWYYSLNYRGYCHAEGRYLSDREKIEVGVKFLLDAVYPPSIPIYEIRNGERIYINNEIPTNPIAYANPEEFFAMNPDCCSFSLRSSQNEDVTTIDRLTGRLSGFASVAFLVRYRTAAGEEMSEPMRADPGISNCGQIWFGN
jgi:hypothetical protein